MGGGGKPPPYMVRYFVAPDDSAGARARARRVVAPHTKKASPFKGEAVERSETDEGAHGGDAPLIAPSSGPAGHLPPCGGTACGASRRPPLRRRKLHIVRFRLAAKARSFRCSSSPHRTRGCRRWASAGAPYILSSDGPSSPVGAHIVRPHKITKEEFSCPPTTPQTTT